MGGWGYPAHRQIDGHNTLLVHLAMSRWFSILSVCFVLTSCGNGHQNIIKTAPSTIKNKDEICSKEHVEIVVSPELNKKTSRRLQFIWWVQSIESGDTISLYLADPLVNLTRPVFSTYPSSTHGWSDTPLQEVYQDITELFTPLCIGYWVVYWRGNNKLAYSCLQTQPSWMTDHREVLGRYQLTELFIPGTHNSACYSVTYSPRELTRYEKYVFTQEESILSQLLHGIRYLDLRVGYDRKKDEFYVHHDFVKLQNFQGVIDDITIFMKHSKDIVILDLHRFPEGFSSDGVHQKFIKLLEQKLGDYMATPALSWQSTLKDIWDSGKQLVVSYNNKEIVHRHMHKLWGPVVQQWGDANRVESLHNFLDAAMKSRLRLEPRAAMAELTPTLRDVILDQRKGLRGLASITNIPLTDWLRTQWGLQSNIVAVDFFRSSGVVSAAIHFNLMRAFNLCA